MSWGIVAATVGGATIGAVGSKMSADTNADAIENAADTQAAGTAAATAETKRQFDIAQKNQQPYLNVGSGANSRLAYLMGIDTTPAYKPKTRAQIEASLRPKFTKTTGGTVKNANMTGTAPQGNVPPIGDWRIARWTVDPRTGQNIPLDSLGEPITDWKASASGAPQGGAGGTTTFDQKGFNAAVQQELIREQQKAKASKKAPGGNFGKLTETFGLDDFYYEPGYKFALQQGEQGIKRNAGVLASGRTLKALMDYNTGMANQQYNNAYSRYNQDQNTLYGRLSDLTRMGQNTAVGMGQQGSAYAGDMSNLITGQANADASARIAGANATASGYQGVANAVTGGINNYLNYKSLQPAAPSPTSTVGPLSGGYGYPAQTSNYGSMYSSWQ